MLLDGAHNPAGAATLAEALDDLAPFLRPAARPWSSRSWPTRTWTAWSTRSPGAALLADARVICTRPARAAGRCRPSELAARWAAAPWRAGRGQPPDGRAPIRAAALDAAHGEWPAGPRRSWPGPSISSAPRGPYSSTDPLLVPDPPLPHLEARPDEPRRSPRRRRRRRPCRTGPTRIGPRLFEWGSRTYVMGIVNVTPDSFSGDGLLAAVGGRGRCRRGRGRRRPGPAHGRGRRRHPRRRRRIHASRARAGLGRGGGGARRPGHRRDPRRPAGRADQRRHVQGRRSRRPRSTPGRRSSTTSGASRPDDAMARLAGERQRPARRHAQPRRGRTTRTSSAELLADLRAALDRAVAAGVPRENLIVDPGFGFGKTPEHNLEVMRDLAELRGARPRRPARAPRASPPWAASWVDCRRRIASRRPWRPPRWASRPASTSSASTTSGPTSGPPAWPMPSSPRSAPYDRSDRASRTWSSRAATASTIERDDGPAVRGRRRAPSRHPARPASPTTSPRPSTIARSSRSAASVVEGPSCQLIETLAESIAEAVLSAPPRRAQPKSSSASASRKLPLPGRRSTTPPSRSPAAAASALGATARLARGVGRVPRVTRTRQESRRRGRARC